MFDNLWFITFHFDKKFAGKSKFRKFNIPSAHDDKIIDILELPNAQS